ncbi:RNA polymerase sigma factor [Xanthovirga aplysinae]|uniref:RNA polymerase sigma factor n=1 Tax=Xanthovirga aplysinae TaxID=2529853 RepID=UPI0012BC6A21|nr:sigma-70 family RNA polymerase sigma factor [Xanthovirga aplysinae]MTI31391.1 sigma-70 family RNA polymerase sigma factor [Xanthovirga aplysinae]
MGKSERYKQEFIKFQGELKSFIYRIVTHREEAEDIAQDTYLKAFKNLNSFQEKSSFKTWVFSIALNLLRDNVRARQRWGKDWQDLARKLHLENDHLLQKQLEVSQVSEHGRFVIREHINFCFSCINKTLLLTQQLCLLLKEVYNFKVKEIILITGLTKGKVKHAIADARKEMSRIFEKRCALINKKGICHQCTELNDKFNPEQKAQIEINKFKMVKEAHNKNYEKLLSLRLQLVKSIDPLHAEGTDLHNYFLENCPDWAKSQKAKQVK